MKEDEIREVIERIDPKGEISQKTQEDLVSALNNIPTHKTIQDMEEAVEENNKDIKKQMDEETDWRKKAELAAKLISNHLG